jgi:hypothetical protein
VITIEDLGNIGEFVAAIATLATLIYLAVQIKQNTRPVQASSVESLMSNVQSNMSLTGSTKENADVYLRGLADFNTLPEPDRTQFIIMITSIYTGLDTVYWSYRNGSLDSDLWRRECNMLRMYLKTEGGRAVFDFNEDAGMFTNPFAQYVHAKLIRDGLDLSTVKPPGRL